jgi:hypothetical protein
MNDVPIPGKDDEGQIFRQIVGHYDAPAYIRRARAVEESFRSLIEHVRRQREELLKFVRLHLATLKAQAGTWEALDGVATVETRERLERWFDELRPTLRVPVEQATSPRVLDRTLNELRQSVERFNRRWRQIVDEINWAVINQVREDYNRYYLLEKECALRSTRLARIGFQRLAPLGPTDVLVELPYLCLP